MAKRSIDEVAKVLADAHRKEDPQTKVVFLSKSDQEVRLIEVSGSVGTTGEVLPFRFAASPKEGIDYPAVVILLSEEDWKKVEDGQLGLPEGWETPRKIA